jgi:phage shock protein C
MEPDARFCSACGTAYAPNAFVQPPIGGRLTRPRHPRVIGGVCSGLALHYGWDVSLVRLILVLCVLFAGTGLFTYILAWIIIPEEPYALPQSTGGVSA